jgi:hypothetical protein
MKIAIDDFGVKVTIKTDNELINQLGLTVVSSIAEETIKKIHSMAQNTVVIDDEEIIEEEVEDEVDEEEENSEYEEEDEDEETDYSEEDDENDEDYVDEEEDDTEDDEEDDDEEYEEHEEEDEEHEEKEEVDEKVKVKTEAKKNTKTTKKKNKEDIEEIKVNTNKVAKSCKKYIEKRDAEKLFEILLKLGRRVTIKNTTKDERMWVFSKTCNLQNINVWSKKNGKNSERYLIFDCKT